MSVHTNIRDMRDSDRSALIGFMAALNDHEIGLSPDRAPGREMAEGHIAFLLEEVEHRGGFTLIAEVDGQTAGFLLAYVNSVDDGDIHLRELFRRSGEISDLFIDPAHRGLGLAKAMITEAERRFRAMALKRMEIRFLSANGEAERLYRSAGFGDHECIFIKAL